MTRVAAFFGMKPLGHVHRTLPLVRRLVRSGVRVVAFVDAKFRREVEAAGAEFFDLFGRFPIDGLDDATSPHSARYVTYAARHGEPVAQELRRLGVSLVLYDTFAVVARAAAEALRLPSVNLCAGHVPDPKEIEADLRRSGFVRLSPQCLDAPRVLRERFGIADAHSFLYVSHRSPHLNVYGEPPQFLGRPCPEPAAHFGSIPDDWESRGKGDACFPTAARLRICISFGTMVWRFFPNEAGAALDVLGETFGRLPHAHTIVTLGGVDAGVKAQGPNVSVRPWVDPWHVLRETDVLVTHHGLNSTHEAIVRQVPMLSYPFLWDQPGLARRCQELGLAVPLAPAPRAPLTPEGVKAALDTLAARRAEILRNLDRALRWETEAIAGRDAVVRRILDL